MTYAAIVLALLFQNPVAAPQNTTGSLFSDSAPNLFLFRDLKARNVNDILTIQIEETSTASNSANTSTKKEGAASVAAPSVLGLKGASALNFANMLTANSALSFAGTGSTSRTGQLQAFVSARVTQVMPNGDLAIEGTKQVTINRERQILKISGIVRSRDVTPSNVVQSTAIANMEVLFDGKGMISDANKPGFLYRLLSWITPF